MAKLWAKIIVKHRIHRQATEPCTFEEIPQTLNAICKQFDIPCPMWLGKQERELENFRLTSFGPDNFVEDVPFQKLEIEYIEDENKKRRSNDPRNVF